MRFHSLPDHMDVGAAELTSVTGSDVLTSYKCSSCGRVGPRFFICERDHILCNGCPIFRANQAGENAGEEAAAPAAAAANVDAVMWCPKCQQVVNAMQNSCPVRLLASVKFRCGCGAEGTLAELRIHLLTDGAHVPGEANRDGDRPQEEQQQQHLDERIRNIALEESRAVLEGIRQEMERRLGVIRQEFDGEVDRNVQELRDEIAVSAAEDSVNELKEQIGTIEVAFAEEKRRLDTVVDRLLQFGLKQKLEMQLNAQKEEILRSTDEITRRLRAEIAEARECVMPVLEAKLVSRVARGEEMVMVKLDNLQAEMRMVKSISSSISASTTGHFWFRLGDLCNEFKLINNGAPHKSDYQVKLIGGIPLKVQIECSTVQGVDYMGVFVGGSDQLPSDVCWPLRRTIVVYVVNNRGVTAQCLSFETMQEDDECHPSFMDPSVDAATGWAEYMSLQELVTGDCITADGNVSVVVQVKPVEVKLYRR